MKLKPKTDSKCPFRSAGAEKFTCRLAELDGAYNPLCLGLSHKHCSLVEEGIVTVECPVERAGEDQKPVAGAANCDDSFVMAFDHVRNAVSRIQSTADSLPKTPESLLIVGKARAIQCSINEIGKMVLTRYDFDNRPILASVLSDISKTAHHIWQVTEKIEETPEALLIDNDALAIEAAVKKMRQSLQYYQCPWEGQGGAESAGEDVVTDPPQIGDGATYTVHSDRHACTIIEIRRNGRELVLQRDKAILENGFDSGRSDALQSHPGGFARHVEGKQHYRYERDPDGTIYRVSQRIINGTTIWKLVGHSTRSPGCIASIGRRSEHYDYDF